MPEEKRYLCWDRKLFENACDVEVRMHHPQKANVALFCDNEWEGHHNGYAGVMRVGDEYRMYYRADSSRHIVDENMSHRSRGVICVATSRDGKTFKKPNVGKFEYNGTKNNNIVFSRESFIDNFAVFYDINPDCPEDERFKALSEDKNDGVEGLAYYASADGYDFRFERFLPVKGTFDSYNVTLWDPDRKKYFLFYRAFHAPDGTDWFDFKGMNIYEVIRDIRVATSEDFVNWTEHGRITFDEGQEDYQLYINQISKYYRSRDVFLGFPIRYYDRAAERRNFDFMPLADRHRAIYDKYRREGTAVTDCAIMTSSDGFVFDRRDEAFITPGIEARDNWWYGNCGTAYGMVETESETPGAPNEISMYVGENYRIKNVNFVRVTLRLDGFFSWYGRYKRGEVITKPLTVSADVMSVNFASSALGGMRITLLDKDGREIEGYKSYTTFGDSIDRPVEFERSLSELRGKTVKLRIELSDCHLYSFVI